jgi:hypothetical protein
MVGVCRSVAITGSTEVGAELNRQSAATIKKLGSEPAILNGFPYSRNRFFDSKVGMVIVDRATERSERSVLHLSGQAEGLLGRCYWPACKNGHSGVKQSGPIELHGIANPQLDFRPFELPLRDCRGHKPVK